MPGPTAGPLRKYSQTCVRVTTARGESGVSTAVGPEGQHEHDRSQTSAQDAHKLAEQLRNAPVHEIAAEAFFVLLNGAQIKLGRRDARLLIDLSTLMFDHARGYLPEMLVKQVDQSLGQLRLGQVSAENKAAKEAQAEPNDLDQFPTPPSKQ